MQLFKNALFSASYPQFYLDPPSRRLFVIELVTFCESPVDHPEIITVQFVTHCQPAIRVTAFRAVIGLSDKFRYFRLLVQHSSIPRRFPGKLPKH